MFDYFRNHSCNAHQLCCKDSQTKGLYRHCQSDDLDLRSFKITSASKTGLVFSLQYLGQYLFYYIQTWHDGSLVDAIYHRARFDDPD